ncbi:receptor-like protein 15 [Quercus suber]|uniref:Receptor-like protein 15 n=1 Tax=Quercus suber TaxID=58331 RepID=A0AAW0JIV3_QUESU
MKEKVAFLRLPPLPAAIGHNKGSIPKTLSNLIGLENLDLCYNSLRREIPPQLIELTFLEVFSAAYNNLSGRTPCMKQFGTFDASSYEGNLFLCGLPLEKNCTRRDDLSPTPMQSSNLSTAIHLWLDLPALFRVELFDMSVNDITGIVPPSIEALSFLKNFIFEKK